MCVCAGSFSAGAMYKMLKSSGCVTPLHDLNWAGYAPCAWASAVPPPLTADASWVSLGASNPS